MENCPHIPEKTRFLEHVEHPVSRRVPDRTLLRQQITLESTCLVFDLRLSPVHHGRGKSLDRGEQTAVCCLRRGNRWLSALARVWALQPPRRV